MHWFKRPDLAVEVKPDGSPVTTADPEVEDVLRAVVASHRPGDGFVGEEVGETGGRDRRWIVDGIDGTAAFAAGRPTWRTLIALEQQGEVIVGVATCPALGRRWWASAGGGAWTTELNGGPSAMPRRCSVSGVATTEAARVRVVPSAPGEAGWRRTVAVAVQDRWGQAEVTLHGALDVAEGRLEASVILSGGPWDHAALVPIVEEAGGRFSDLWGGRRIDTRTALFSNGRLHSTVVDAVVEARH